MGGPGCDESSYMEEKDESSYIEKNDELDKWVFYNGYHLVKEKMYRIFI